MFHSFYILFYILVCIFNFNSYVSYLLHSILYFIDIFYNLDYINKEMKGIIMMMKVYHHQQQQHLHHHQLIYVKVIFYQIISKQ